MRKKSTKKPTVIFVIGFIFVLMLGTACTKESSADTTFGNSLNTSTLEPGNETGDIDSKETNTPRITVESTPKPTLNTNVNYEYKPLTNIPSLYIDLDNNKQKRNISKENYIDAKISLVGTGVDKIIGQKLQVKGRGNFSWSFDKKPLTLKFDKKIDLLGMGSGKKWVLINNYVDKTLMRNYLTFKFAADMGLEYTPECRFVDVFINGQYEGNYLLFEKITIADGRVDIAKSKGVLFEIEMQFRHNDCEFCYETPSGVHIMYSDYDDNDAISEAQEEENLKALMSSTNKFLRDMDNSLKKGYSEYSKYIDVDSFINWYIVNEFAKNYDSKFVTSCYCYIGNDGKLHMGPVWDYDTCYGNQNTDGCMYPEGFHVSQAPWYSILLNDKDFSTKLSQRWKKVIDDGIIDGLFKHIERADTLIKESVKKNFERWPEALDYELRREELCYSYEDELEHFKRFISGRKDWLTEQWDLEKFKVEPEADLGNFKDVTNKVDLKSVDGSIGANEREEAKYIFDGNTETKFCTRQWLPIYVQWKMTEKTEIKAYSMATANDVPGRTPKHWKLFASNDGKNWTVVSEVKNGGMSQMYYSYKGFKVSNPGSYMFYKLEIYENTENHDTTQFSELVLGA